MAMPFAGVDVEDVTACGPDVGGAVDCVLPLLVWPWCDCVVFASEDCDATHGTRGASVGMYSRGEARSAV